MSSAEMDKEPMSPIHVVHLDLGFPVGFPSWGVVMELMKWFIIPTIISNVQQEGSLSSKLLQVWRLFHVDESTHVLASDPNALTSTSEAFTLKGWYYILEGQMATANCNAGNHCTCDSSFSSTGASKLNLISSFSVAVAMHLCLFPPLLGLSVWRCGGGSVLSCLCDHE